MHEADELPKMICDNCLYKLELLFDFRDRAMRTETLLVDLYKELNATRLQNEHMVKMNVVPMDHSDLIMVDQHQLLTDHNIQNVNEIDLSHLGQRNNIIVEHEIILSHQNVDLSSHSLDTISLNHNLTNQDLSNHSLSGANTILVDESGSMHGIADVRYSEANLDLIRHEHMLTEQYRLQNSIQVAISESSLNNSLNESIQLPNNSLCKVNIITYFVLRSFKVYHFALLLSPLSLSVDFSIRSYSQFIWIFINVAKTFCWVFLHFLVSS